MNDNTRNVWELGLLTTGFLGISMIIRGCNEGDRQERLNDMKHQERMAVIEHIVNPCAGLPSSTVPKLSQEETDAMLEALKSYEDKNPGRAEAHPGRY